MASGINERCLQLAIDLEQTYWGQTKPAACFLITRTEAIRKEHSEEMFHRLSILYDEISEKENTGGTVYRIENKIIDSSFDAVKQILNRLSKEV